MCLERREWSYKVIKLITSLKGSVAVGACDEWSPNLDTRNNVQYYSKNQVWYQITL